MLPCRQLQSGGRAAFLVRPPEVVLHSLVASQGRAQPAAVGVAAALDDARPAVGGELFEHESEAAVQVRPLPQFVGHARVQPQRMLQPSPPGACAPAFFGLEPRRAGARFGARPGCCGCRHGGAHVWLIMRLMTASAVRFSHILVSFDAS